MDNLLVMGGGFSGLVTAARAAQLEARVVALEQGTEDHYLCNSRMSSGVSNVVGWAMDLPEDELVEIMERSSGGYANPELVRAFAAHSGRSLAWLRDEGFRFEKCIPRQKNAPVGLSHRPGASRRGWIWRGVGRIFRWLYWSAN